MAKIYPYRDKDGKIVSYQVKVCLGRDDLGKQIWATTSIRPPEGLTPKKTIEAVQLEANNWEKEQREKFKQTGQAAQKRGSKESTTFADFVNNRWLLNFVDGKRHKPTTKSFYRYMAADIVSYFGTKLKIGEIDIDRIEDYETFLRNKSFTKAGKPISDTSVRRHLETLRNILRYAKTTHYIKTNPFEDYKIENLKKNTVVDYLHEDEVSRFFSCLQDERTFWQLYMLMSLIQGFRRGEILALKWEDVDMEGQVFFVRHNLTVDVQSEKGYNIDLPKSGEARTTPFGNNVASILEQFRVEQEERYGTIEPDFYVFCRDGNPKEPLYPTTPTTWLRRFEIRNNLRHISPHDFRHSAGTYLRKIGFTDRDIQDHLGHSDARISHKFYVAEDLTLKRNAVDGLESYVMGLIHKDD